MDTQTRKWEKERKKYYENFNLSIELDTLSFIYENFIRKRCRCVVLSSPTETPTETGDINNK